MNPDLREKDLAVLLALREGASNVSGIREATTFTNREINYGLNEYSLEDLGLVEIDRPAGREWREFDGTERRIWRSKQVELTDEGIQALNQAETTDRFEGMSKRELIEKVRELEVRLDRVDNLFKEFRKNVMERL